MDLLVRGIERSEVRAAAEIIAEGTLSVGDEHPERVADYWSAVLETRARGGEVFVGIVGGDVVGLCQVLVFRHFQHTGGWCAELESVYVRADRRGAGIGARLIATAEEHARRAGCYRIQLTSRNVRTDAHRFYLANDYQQTSQGFRKSLDHLA